MEVRILGRGCPKCREVEKRLLAVLAELGVTADVRKVADLTKIIEHGVLETPGLVIDGTVKSSGRIPRPEEIRGWIKEASS